MTTDNTPKLSVRNEPISNIVDGWTLKCGCLYLHVFMGDEVTRTTIIPRTRSFVARTAMCAGIHGESR